MIDVPGNHLETVRKILAAHVPGREVRAFGSRVTGTANSTSDLDLAVMGEGRLDRRTKVLLREAFEESNLPFRIDVESLALGCNYTFRTDAGDLDLLGFVEPIGGFEELERHAETIPIGDIDVKIIALEDLIRIKEHLGRPKDRDSLLHLQAIKRLRDSQWDK